MVRMITEDEMERSKQAKTSEQLKLKKQITDIVENLKEKLNKAIMELKTVKEENEKLKQQLEEANQALAEQRTTGTDQTGAGPVDKGLLESLREEIHDLRSTILERDKKIELDREVLERTTAYKEELEKRISDLTTELHQMTDSMKGAKDSTRTTPIFTPVKEATAGQVSQQGAQPKGRLLSGRNTEGGSILGQRDTGPAPRPAVGAFAEQIDDRTDEVVKADVADAAPTAETARVETPPEVAESTATETVKGTAPASDDEAICPVCGGEGVIGVRKKDGSIVQEVCPNCRGSGKV